LLENKNGAVSQQPRAFPAGILCAGGWICAALSAAAALFFVGSALLSLVCDGAIGGFFIGLLLAAGCGAWAAFFWNAVSAIGAKYRYTPEGLYAKYPLQREMLLPWDSFQQICICYSNYTHAREGGMHATSVLCFVKKGEKKNSLMRWKTENLFHHRSVIAVDYTPQLYVRVAEVCPRRIDDLRQAAAYKIQY